MTAPLSAMVRTRMRAPSFRRTRSLYARSSVASGKPLSKATRSRSAPSKGISPRMERSVIAAICGLMPAKSAISSMHSQPMIVESMSAISRRLRRRSSATTLASTGALASAARTVSTMAGSAMRNSQAVPGASQWGDVPAIAAAAFDRCVIKSAERRGQNQRIVHGN